MSLPSITRVKKSIKAASVFTLLMMVLSTQVFAWEIDFSRRRKDNKKEDLQSTADTAQSTVSSGSFLDSILIKTVPQADIVILNTDKGFLPRNIHMKVGTKYNVHVVNINEKERNVSFVMDTFNQYTSTFYGQLKSFVVEPKKEGIFSFQCPETSIEGRLVVVGDGSSAGPVPIRAPANEEK